MAATFQSYDFVSAMARIKGVDGVEYQDEYMDKQPRLMGAFERHAQNETLLFKEMGLLCSCDEPAVMYPGGICTSCKLPTLRLDVLAAELNVAVPDGVRQNKAKEKKGRNNVSR